MLFNTDDILQCLQGFRNLTFDEFHFGLQQPKQ